MDCPVEYIPSQLTTLKKMAYNKFNNTFYDYDIK